MVELDADATRGTVVTRLRGPSIRDTTAVARVGDRYLVVNAGWNDPPPYTISSVPVASRAVIRLPRLLRDHSVD